MTADLSLQDPVYLHAEVPWTQGVYLCRREGGHGALRGDDGGAHSGLSRPARTPAWQGLQDVERPRLPGPALVDLAISAKSFGDEVQADLI